MDLIPCCVCLHTSLLPHYILVDVDSAQTCLRRHFRDLMSYPVLLTAYSYCYAYFVDVLLKKGNKGMFFSDGH